MTPDQIDQFTSTLASTEVESFSDRAKAQQSLDELIKIASNLRIALAEDDTPELRLVLARGRIKAMRQKKLTKNPTGIPNYEWEPVNGFSTINVPFSRRFMNAAKDAIPNIKWEAEQSSWSFPTSQSERIAAIVAKHFKVDELRQRVA